uniref:Uncharacterized protein n=1 Tax=Caenorhabditis tropicalis TaxID=1561998 RepID=A0A1I7UNV1_9PELO
MNLGGFVPLPLIPNTQLPILVPALPQGIIPFNHYNQWTIDWMNQTNSQMTSIRPFLFIISSCCSGKIQTITVSFLDGLQMIYEYERENRRLIPHVCKEYETGINAQFGVRKCPVLQKEVVTVFDFVKNCVERFEFRDSNFERHDCGRCSSLIYEDELTPKYAEIAEDGNCIIHVVNAVTRMYEKYWFNCENGSFEQVNYPELQYDSSKDSTSTVLHVTPHDLTTYAITRNAQGTLQVEVLCPLTKQFEVVAPEAVVTLFSAIIKRIVVPVNFPDTPGGRKMQYISSEHHGSLLARRLNLLQLEISLGTVQLGGEFY